MEERREVIQALLEMECLPAGMEMFPAADDDQWTLIQQVINESDYYIVIIGGRYGSVAPDGMSYTEKEYDYAVSTGKPVLGFVHADPGQLPLDKSQPTTQAELDAFLAKVRTRLVKTYTSPAELGSAVSRSLIKVMKRNPAEGWVRGQYAMTPETQAELAELRATVKELQLDAVATARKAMSIPEELASGDDSHEIEVLIDYRSRSDLHDEFNIYSKTLHHTAQVTVTWNDVIGELGLRLFDEANEQELGNALNDFVRRLLLSSHRSLLPNNFGEAEDISISQQSFDRIMLQLFALNLTEHGTKPRGVADRSKYWKLTELGQDTLMKLRAIKKETPGLSEVDG